MIHDLQAPDDGAAAEDPYPCPAPLSRRRGRPPKNGVSAVRRRRPRGCEGGTQPASPEVGVIILPDHDGSFVPTGEVWHGITWHDVPGHDKSVKKLNFTLLKRGMLRGHQCCARLHGEALKQRLMEISERNRDNSQVRQPQDLRCRKRTQPHKPP